MLSISRAEFLQYRRERRAAGCQDRLVDAAARCSARGLAAIHGPMGDRTARVWSVTRDGDTVTVRCEHWTPMAPVQSDASGTLYYVPGIVVGSVDVGRGPSARAAYRDLCRAVRWGKVSPWDKGLYLRGYGQSWPGL